MMRSVCIRLHSPNSDSHFILEEANVDQWAFTWGDSQKRSQLFLDLIFTDKPISRASPATDPLLTASIKGSQVSQKFIVFVQFLAFSNSLLNFFVPPFSLVWRLFAGTLKYINISEIIWGKWCLCIPQERLMYLSWQNEQCPCPSNARSFLLDIFSRADCWKDRKMNYSLKMICSFRFQGFTEYPSTAYPGNTNFPLLVHSFVVDSMNSCCLSASCIPFWPVCFQPSGNNNNCKSEPWIRCSWFLFSKKVYPMCNQGTWEEF